MPFHTVERRPHTPLPDPTPDHPWPLVRSQLRQAVTDSTWHLWLESLEFRELLETTIVVAAPGPNQRWVTDRFGRLLRACAKSVMGPEAEVRVVAQEQGPDPTPEVRLRNAAASVADQTAAGRRERFNPRLTFDQFVIGDSNRFAHAAALAVAEMPGLAYNPLFICGPPGLGKTHLLHSIANYVSANGDGATARYTTVEGFTNHFIGALHGGDIDAFKETYRGVDVLIVDDIQFLQSKVKTEEEFFHTFNALLAAGAQLVLSSDRPPRDMDALETRLRERFEAGLVCDVRSPDYETRLTILRKRVQQDAIEGVDTEVLELLAERIADNVRALEGAFIRIVAFASLTGRAVDAGLASEVLRGLYPELKPKGRTLREIQEHVCAAFSLPLEELLSASRTAEPARARQIAMYLARELTRESLPAIGRAFGDRKHTTVMHACKTTAARIANDRDTSVLVDRLRRELRDHPDDRPA